MPTEKLSYRDGDVELEAHVAWEGEGRRPAVLVSHAFAGQGEPERRSAERLAAWGYTGIALDNYGKGVFGQTRDECRALMTPFLEDRAKLQKRLLAGFEAARKHPRVDPDRIAAIGFCFGGLCALDLARSGAALRGVASFHGLFTQSPLPKQKILAKVLVLHGFDDPMATPEHTLALERELTEAGVDWQVHVYGGTMHAFTNPAANDPAFGTVYQPNAHRRSLASLKLFLEEIFG